MTNDSDMHSNHSRTTRSAACAELITVSATAAKTTEYFRTIIETLLRLRLSRRRHQRRRLGLLRVVRRDIRVAIVFREHAGQDRTASERRGIFAVSDDIVRETRGQHERRL